MNLFTTQLERTDNGLAVSMGDQHLALPAETVAANPELESFAGGPIVVGLRPEDIEDAALASDAPADRRITSTVTMMESLGSEIILHFPMPMEPFAIMDAEFEGEDAVAAATDETGNYIYVARVNPRSPARIGQSVELVVDTGRFHFFDPKTGAALTGS